MRANEGGEKAPLFMYAELDGPGRETRVGRPAQSRMEVDFHVTIHGRSEKLATYSATLDASRGIATLTFTMDGLTHTKTFDVR